MKKMGIRVLTLGLTILASIQMYSQNVTTLLNDPSKSFEALHWHEDGRIYSVDYYNGRVYQIYLDGTAETIVSGFQNLAGGGFDNLGHFYFAGIADSTIYRLNDDNTYEQLLVSGLDQPVGILPSDNSDTLYVTEYGNSKVTKFSISTGEKFPFASGDGILGPDAIIEDWSGNIFVSNYNNHKINRINSDGDVSLFCNVPSSGFMGYVKKIGDYLYVPSISARKIYRIDMDGNATVIAGSGTAGNSDGEGLQATFTGPNGTCHNAAGDTLLIGDGPRIRIITNFEPALGLNINKNSTQLILSPNPCSDKFVVQYSGTLYNELQWKVLDIHGAVKKTGIQPTSILSEQEFTIPVPELVNGHYILFVEDEKGNRKQMAFVIQK